MCYHLLHNCEIIEMYIKRIRYTTVINTIATLNIPHYSEPYFPIGSKRHPKQLVSYEC